MTSLMTSLMCGRLGDLETMSKRKFAPAYGRGGGVWGVTWRGESVEAVGQTAHQAYLDAAPRFVGGTPRFDEVECKPLHLDRGEHPTVKRPKPSAMAMRVGMHLKMSGVLTPLSSYGEKWCQELLETADILTGDKS